MVGGGPAVRSPGLATRLLAAQALVIVTVVVTAWLVAAAVGTPIFHEHLHRAGHDGQDAAHHAEQAFRAAGAISLTVALVAALVAALAVSAYVTRRIVTPISALAAAAHDVAAGTYPVDVPAPGIGPEFDTLARSFAAMAGQLHAVEVTRRRLLADLAHEMRTPVATLDAYLEGIEDGVAHLDNATARMLRAQTARLARLAEDMTAVSRAEEHQLTLHRQLLHPTELVRAAVAAASDRYAAKGVALRGDADPGLPPVLVDPDRINQVLANLLDNALRHTPAGGRVTVTAAVRPATGPRGGTSTETAATAATTTPTAAAAAAGPREVVLSVADTGAGVPAEHLPHLFERFYRADAARDREHGGSGIGLAIAKALVEAHGGGISATSAGPGSGAVFALTLPAAAR